ncbi:MAG: hypothetical protein WDZ68_01680 [Candidatus Paceibacterota bacterium]
MKINEIIEDVRSRYNEPHRFYHNLDHVLEMLTTGLRIQTLTVQQILGIWFHDAVYVVGRKDNEKQSAELARNMLSGALPDRDIQEVVDIILSTEPPHIPKCESAEIVVDLDLAGLSSDFQGFLGNTEKIKQEMEPIIDSEEKWISGRVAFLRQYMQRKPFYYTESFSFLESIALENMKLEIEMLSHSKIFSRTGR